MWSRLLVGCLLVGAACRSSSDPLVAAKVGLRELAAAARVHRHHLTQRLRDRDDLGPGEYRDRLRSAGRSAVRALGFEYEARAARLLAGGGLDLARLDATQRRQLETLLPAGVAALGNAPPVNLLAHAYQAAAEARRLRARSDQSVGELRELRERVLDLRGRLARARLRIGEILRKLGAAQVPTRRELEESARARRVRLRRVRQVREADDGRVVRRSLELDVEGTFPAVARYAAALADRAELERLEVEGDPVTRGSLRLTYRAPHPEAVPLPRQAPSSTPSLLMLRLRDAEAWRRDLSAPSPPGATLADVLLAVVRALPSGGRVTRFATEGGRFSLLLRTPRARVRKFLAQLAAQPGVDLLRPISSGSRLAVRGRWRRDGSGAATGLEPLVLASSSGSPRRPRSAPSPAPLPPGLAAESWTLAGVVSAGDHGETRALLRDSGGRTVIVKVGSAFGLGYQVVQIGRTHVLARAGRRLVRIVGP